MFKVPFLAQIWLCQRRKNSGCFLAKYRWRWWWNIFTLHIILLDHPTLAAWPRRRVFAPCPLLHEAYASTLYSMVVDVIRDVTTKWWCQAAAASAVNTIGIQFSIMILYCSAPMLHNFTCIQRSEFITCILYTLRCICLILFRFYSFISSCLRGFMVIVVYFMVALCNRADHIYSSCSFFLSIFFLFFPRLISAVGDWMSAILPHMVWP